MTRLLLALGLIFIPVTAKAGCELATGPCSTDRQGNTYRTERNLGGGYNTYENGRLHSQTEQNLSGGHTTDYRDGRPSTSHNTNPYGQNNNQQNNSNGYNWGNNNGY
jgi:hypothetical protein